MTREAIGIVAMGSFLPGFVRSNAAWGEAPTLRNGQARAFVLDGHADVPNERPAFDIAPFVRKYADDPFRGARTRRVAQAPLTTATMESIACEQALTRGQRSGKEIAVIVSCSMPSEHYIPDNATAIQASLGAENAACFGLQGTCTGFLAALEVAHGLLRARPGSYGLVAVSSMLSQLIDMEDPLSVTVGDGAAAALLGPVPEGHGRLGAYQRGLAEHRHTVACVPMGEGPWYRGQGPLQGRSLRSRAGRALVAQTGDHAATAMAHVLKQAGLATAEISHYYGHQGSAWLNEACRHASGLTHCRTLDSFATLGSMGPASIPINMAQDWEDGALGPGDTVALFSIGMGVHVAASVLRL